MLLSHDHKFSSMEKKCVFSFVITSLVCVVLLATSFNIGLMSSLRPPPINGTLFRFANNDSEVVAEQQPREANDKLPRFAYLVSGSKGDLESLWRTLRALYHPRNQYIVHLDLESPVYERLELDSRIKNDPMYSKIRNVYMIAKANLVTYTGPTMVANTLHACAILLKRSPDWDWFINLSASDYPLVTQDGKCFHLFLLFLIFLLLALINNVLCLKICFIRFRLWTGTSTLSNTQVT